jgi:hypothetical protein
MGRPGTRRAWGAAVLLLVVAVAGGCAGRAPRGFAVDWTVAQATGGPVVRGTVRNPYALPARDLHIVVEGLDGAGAVSSRTLGRLPAIVRSGEAMPFSLAVPPAAGYRVRVVSYDLQAPAPAGGRR